jgi:hypothetical protein
MHDDDAAGGSDFCAMPGDRRIQFRVLLDFGGRKEWRELFLIKIVKRDAVSGGAQRLCGGVGDGVVETSRCGMGQDDRGEHQFSAE